MKPSPANMPRRFVDHAVSVKPLDTERGAVAAAVTLTQAEPRPLDERDADAGA